MKASELIEHLKLNIEQHGNLEVSVTVGEHDDLEIVRGVKLQSEPAWTRCNLHMNPSFELFT